MTKHLHSIMFPNKEDRYTPTLGMFPEPRETYLKKLFDQRPVFFADNFSDSDDILNNYTKIEVRAILCDSNRNYIYLVYDDDKRELCIPGGSISKDDLNSPYTDAESIVILSLMRNMLVQLDSVYGDSLYRTMRDDMVGTARSKLTNVLYSKFLNVDEMRNAYFSYMLPNESFRKLTLYYVFEFNPVSPVYGGQPKLPKNIIPLDKELFRISLRCKTKKEVNSLLELGYMTKGVVYNHYGRTQLRSILNTTDIF